MNTDTNGSAIAAPQTALVHRPRAAGTLDLAPHSIDEAVALAERLSKASLLPKALQGNTGNTLIVLMMGMEFGMSPMSALRSISVINGKPTMDAQPLIGLILRSGLCEYFDCVEDGTKGVATWVTKRVGRSERSASFSLDDAKKAGLLGKEGPWQQYPANMLRWRAGANLARLVYPDIAANVYLPEEIAELRAEMGDDGVFSAPPSPPAAVSASATSSPATAASGPAVIDPIDPDVARQLEERALTIEADMQTSQSHKDLSDIPARVKGLGKDLAVSAEHPDLAAVKKALEQAYRQRWRELEGQG